MPPAYFTAHVDIEPRRAVVRLDGELDVAVLSEFESAIDHAERTGVPLVVVDVENLSYIDSSGIGVLLAAEDRARANNHRLSVVRPRGAVARVFDLLSLSTLLPKAEAA